MTDDLQTWLAYNRWADERMIASCEPLSPELYARDVGGSFPSVSALLAHIAAAADAWRRRLEGLPTPRLLTHEDLPTLRHAAEVLRASHDALDAALAARTGSQLELNLVYRNTRGIEVRLPTWAVFRHLVNHATYHRGQLVTHLRALGATPAPTDFFVWVLQPTA